MKNIKKIYVAIALVLGTLSFSSCDDPNTKAILDALGLTQTDAAEGLKQALNVGTDTSVKILSKLDGYYKDQIVKILLPPEAAPMFTNIAKIPGGQQLIENTILSINRAAEDAAIEATPIFKDAILNISFADALSILNGNDTAATSYLNTNTNEELTVVFEPKIKSSLSKPLVGNTSAESAYTSMINTYNDASLNGVLFPKITQNTLSKYVTEKALKGLFHKVGVEEQKIRNDVSHQVSEVLKKTFAK